MLVKYSYYDNPVDIRNVVHPLIEMLDGRTDVPYASECMHVVMTYKYTIDYTDGKGWL